MSEHRLSLSGEDPISSEQSSAGFERINGIQDIGYGAYWKGKDDGRIVIVVDLHYVGKELHAISYKPLSVLSDNDNDDIDIRRQKIIVAEFLSAFELSSQDEAEKHCARNMAVAQKRLTDLQSKFLSEASTPPKPEKVHRLSSGDAASIVENERLHVSSTEDYAWSLTKWREKCGGLKSKIVDNNITISMVVEDQMAVVEAQVNRFKPLMDAAGSLLRKSSVYLGEGENIIVASTGKPCSDEDTLFRVEQDVMYMDEESLINGLEGGASFSDLNSFVAALGSDAELVSRIFPTRKGIVGMQIRRKEKARVFNEPDISTILQAAAENEANKERFLIIRDGENITLVFSGYKIGDKLFPDQNEMDGIFSKWRKYDAENDSEDSIVRSDLNYDELHDKYKSAESHYHSFVILLQGLIDRNIGVFSPFPVRPNLFDVDTMNSMFSFTYYSSILSETIGSFDEYVSDLNRNICDGSMVVFKPCDFWDKYMVPSAFSYNIALGKSYQKWSPKVGYSGWECLLVHMDSGDMSVMVPCSGKKNGVKLKISVCSSVMCIDQADIKMLDAFLNSRRERKHYIRLVPMIYHAKEILLSRMDEQMS